MQNTRAINVIQLILAIIAVEFVGFASAWLSGNIRGNYLAFNLPPGSPPTWLFGLVWPLLYLFIGIAGYLIWASSQAKAARQLNQILFISQLVLNFFWTIIFFNGSQFWLGVLIILIMDGIVFTMIYRNWRTQAWISWLMLPYLIWLLFASYLAISVAILN